MNTDETLQGDPPFAVSFFGERFLVPTTTVFFPRDVISLTPRATSRERNGFNNNTSRRLPGEIGNFTFSPRLKTRSQTFCAPVLLAAFPVPEIERRERQERDVFLRDTRVHVFTRL